MGVKVVPDFLLSLALAGLLLASCATPAKKQPLAAKPVKVVDWNRFTSSVILKTYRQDQSFICSAVLIAPQVALTTAHCITQSDKNELLVGTSLTDSKLETIPVIQTSIRIHPGYHPKKSLSHADLAVFKIERPAAVTVYPAIPPPRKCTFNRLSRSTASASACATEPTHGHGPKFFLKKWTVTRWC
jgi:secreted trypsin-like serine protease